MDTLNRITSLPDLLDTLTRLGVTGVEDRGAYAGKSITVATWPDGCRTAILITDQGQGKIRPWPETDLSAIVYAAATDRSGQYWFVRESDLQTLGTTGCAEHTCAHWRAQHAPQADGAALAPEFALAT